MFILFLKLLKQNYNPIDIEEYYLVNIIIVNYCIGDLI